MTNAENKQVLLCILDGFGINKTDLKNAILHAKKPNFDFLFKNYPFATLESGGEAVGLPQGVAGNSEVGHLNLGAGRPVRQDLVRINEAIELNTFKDLPRFKELLDVTKNKSKRLHLMGLLSDGGVHSHINHLKHILGLLKNENEIEIYLHVFLDGRDTPKNSGLRYLDDILKFGGFTLASLQGRSIGMDRDRRWEKIQLCLDTICGNHVSSDSPIDYVKSQYEKNIYDEFISPVLFTKNGSIKNNDSVFFFNFRPDRAKQISLALNDPQFKEFPTHVKLGYFLCLSPYIQDELPHLPILFDKEKIPGTLAEYLSLQGLKQFKIAETEKYAHVTYFFNGGEEKPFPGEERKLVPSPREVATYDLKPEMSALVVKNELIKKLEQKDISLFVVNFANGDMVGHTGNYEATVKAIEVLDDCIGELYQKCKNNKITMIITADHGNADQMAYPDGSAHTSHSSAPVPFCLVNDFYFHKSFKNPSETIGSLQDIATTIIDLLAISKSPNFTGRSLCP